MGNFVSWLGQNIVQPAEQRLGNIVSGVEKSLSAPSRPAPKVQRPNVQLPQARPIQLPQRPVQLPTAKPVQLPTAKPVVMPTVTPVKLPTAAPVQQAKANPVQLPQKVTPTNAPQMTFKQLGQGIIKNPIVDTGAGIVQGTGQSVVKVSNLMAPAPKGTPNGIAFTPTSWIDKALLGGKPVTTFGKDISGTQKQLEAKGIKGPLAVPASYGLVGLATAGNLMLGAGPEKDAVEEAATHLISGLTDMKDASQVIDKGAEVGIKITPAEASKIAKTSDPNVVASTLGKSRLNNIDVKASQAIQGAPVGKVDNLTPEQQNAFGDIINSKGTKVGKDIQKGNYTTEPPISMSPATDKNGEPFNYRTPQENSKLNPVKADEQNIVDGNYQGARIDAQARENMIQNRGKDTANAVNRLSKSDKSLFRYAVEDPKLIKTAENPAQMQESITRWNELTNMVHAQGQALHGNVDYAKNYMTHIWDLTDPAQKAKYDQMALEKGFHGVNGGHRVFSTIKEGEENHFQLLNKNPLDDLEQYTHNASNQIHDAALNKGMLKADKTEFETNGPTRTPNENKNFSAKGNQEQQFYNNNRKQLMAMRAYRAVNSGAKRTLLSLSQFHPINIGLQSSMTSLLTGHPVRAVQQPFDAMMALVSKGHAENVLHSMLMDGTLDGAAKIGTPILHGSDFSTSGLLSASKKFGENKIFQQQIPVMHGRLVQGILSDLEKKGISLDSPEAQAVGLSADRIMGFVNGGARNFNPQVQKALSDLALAPQFTRSKWETIGSALNILKWDTAHNMSRAAVIGKYGADVALGIGISYLTGQQSDNLLDTAKRMIVHPSIATPWKDAKGNTIQLNLPANFVSELMGLVTTLNRGDNGHLNVSLSNPGQDAGNLETYGRNRLGVLPGAILKVLTNQNYAGKPLYDPTTDLKTQAEQAATTLLSGNIPIGLQGLVYNKDIMNLLPKASQDILKANSPGSNPLLKSVGSSFGLTPVTDKTVGKGQQTTQYYAALGTALSGLQGKAKDAFNLNYASDKNPVTGAYLNTPNAEQTVAKYAALAAYPDALKAANKMNQQLQNEGQKVDPFFSLTPAQQKVYLTIKGNTAPLDPNRTALQNSNSSWLPAFEQKQSDFYNSLPPGDPNKPTNPIKYPQASSAVTALQAQYDKLFPTGSTDSTGKSTFLNAHPELIDQWNAQRNYDNQIRVSMGLPAMKDSPQPSAATQKFMDTYNAADKETRKTIRANDPNGYQSMIAYYDSADLSTINKQGAVDQLVGQPDQTSSQNKAISNLGQDIYQNSDGTYNIVPAGWMNGLTNSSSGYSYGSSSGPKKLSASAVKTVHLPSTHIPKVKTVKIGVKNGGYKVPKVGKVKLPKSTSATIKRNKLLV